VNIGTPGQPLRVAVDTGSDELWVNPVCSSPTLDEQQQLECRRDGHYVANRSSTSTALAGQKAISYGKGDVLIDYYTDTVSQPETAITAAKVQFGVARLSQDLNEGILGLGFGNGKNLKYNNFVDELAAQNLTRSRAFSVALGSAETNNGGVITFGGVDTKKFTGRLAALPILPPQAPEPVHRYWVRMDSISIAQPGHAPRMYANSSAPVVVDSGSSLSYLPAGVVRSMAQDLRGVWDRAARLYFVPCGQATASAGGSFEFAFGGGAATVVVPFSEFIWNVDGRNCVLGAAPVDPGSGVTALLGDTFLRSAYVVFDQTSRALYVAPYANCGQNEHVLPEEPGAALNFTGECQPKKNAAGRTRYGGAAWVAVAAAAGLVSVL